MQVASASQKTTSDVEFSTSEEDRRRPLTYSMLAATNGSNGVSND